VNNYYVRKEHEDLYKYLKRTDNNGNNKTYAINMYCFEREIREVFLEVVTYVLFKKPDSFISCTSMVRKLGEIDISIKESAEYQFDIGVIEYLLLKGLKFDLNLSLKAAIRLEHKKLVRLLMSHGAELNDTDISRFLIQGIPIHEYICNPAHSNILDIAEKI